MGPVWGGREGTVREEGEIGFCNTGYLCFFLFCVAVDVVTSFQSFFKS